MYQFDVHLEGVIKFPKFRWESKRKWKECLCASVCWPVIVCTVYANVITFASSCAQRQVKDKKIWPYIHWTDAALIGESPVASFRFPFRSSRQWFLHVFCNLIKLWPLSNSFFFEYITLNVNIERADLENVTVSNCKINWLTRTTCGGSSTSGRFLLFLWTCNCRWSSAEWMKQTKKLAHPLPARLWFGGSFCLPPQVQSDRLITFVFD